MLRDSVRELPIVKHILRLRSEILSWWFDVTRNVQTRGYIPLDGLTLSGDAKGCDYLPTFAQVAGKILRQLPSIDYSSYIFVDIGSGKGRMLLVAAEYPFRQIQGIEFATELHECAKENIRRYRCRRQKCANIESLNLNAMDYDFPDQNLVLYFFNPFGREVMEAVLGRLDASLRDHPRDVFVVMLHSEFTRIADAMPRLRFYAEGRRYRIYRSCPGAETNLGEASHPNSDAARSINSAAN
jgi:SAM-dependent methyltransferase